MATLTVEPLRSVLTDLNPRELHPALHRATQDEGWGSAHSDEYSLFG